MFRTIAISALLAATVLPAAAQASDIDQVISAYNEAATSGSREDRVAAARALGAAAQANPDRDDAGLLAYEAGQTLCVLAACEGASQLADFADSAPLPDGAVSQADITVLSTYADWKENPNSRNRRALDEALAAVVDHDVSMLTLTAFQARYAHDFEKADWRSAEVSAGAAATHFKPFRKVIGREWSDATIGSIIAGFSDEPEPQNAIDMARHRVELTRLKAGLEEEPEWLETKRYLSHAWQLALSAYFNSGGGRRTGSLLRGPDPTDEIEAIEAEIEEMEAAAENEARERDAVNGTDQLPFCEGHLNMSPPLRYPGQALKQGMYGAVIVRLSIENLNVAGVEVLAAVPSATFEERASETIEQWTWKVSSGTPGETCRTSHDDLVLPVIFELR